MWDVVNFQCLLCGGLGPLQPRLPKALRQQLLWKGELGRLASEWGWADSALLAAWGLGRPGRAQDPGAVGGRALALCSSPHADVMPNEEGSCGQRKSEIG